MSNIYGLDFLRSEHTLDGDGVPKRRDDETALAPGVVDDGLDERARMEKFRVAANKPDLEKQFDILAFLQAHRGSGCLAPSVIYDNTGIDLESDAAVAEMLAKNPKVKVEMIPDPENPSLSVATYSYQAKYSNVRDRTTLLAQINRMTSGVPMRDLLDSYLTVQEDINGLITAGDIIAVANTEDKDKILFPRGDVFLVELDGVVALPPPPPVEPEPVAPTPPPSHPPQTDTATEQKDDDAAGGAGNQSLENDEKDARNEKTAAATSDTTKKGQQQDGDGETNDGEKPSRPPSPSPPSKPPTDAESDAAATAAGSDDRPERKQDPPPPPPPPKKKPEICIVETDVDPRTQVRRGEAVQVGGQWFRVSSAVREGVPLSEQPARAQAPNSVVSLSDLSKRNEIDGYVRPFTSKALPLDHPLSETAQRNIEAAKSARELLIKLTHGRGSGGVAGQLLGSLAHASNPTTLAASISSSAASAASMRKRPNARISGSAAVAGSGSAAAAIASQEALQRAASNPSLCLYGHGLRHGVTRDVRQMYLETRTKVPESDAELHRLLLEHKLLEPGEQLRRPRLAKSSNVDNDGKPKKRRYYERKNQRMTNTHLEGTEIGAILALAAEKQKQGKSVGDGGM